MGITTQEKRNFLNLNFLDDYISSIELDKSTSEKFRKNETQIYRMKRNRNLCGEESTCKCSQSKTPGVISVDECQTSTEGIIRISKITAASKIAIEPVLVGAKYLSEIRFEFSDNQIEEIVDFTRSAFNFLPVRVLEFENNPKLVLGHIERELTVLGIKATVIKKHGVAKIHDFMFASDNLTFSDFSASLHNFYFGTIKTVKDGYIWQTFAVVHLLIEGKFLDFSTFSGLTVTTITIRNVISINDVELAPQGLFSKARALRELTIVNTSNFHLNDFFFHELYSDPSYSLALEVDIWNIRQNTFAPRVNLTQLERLNQVNITDDMRDIISTKNDTSECSAFCLSSNGTKMNCYYLNSQEKRACGICVKNIVGESNLTKELGRVCEIVNMPRTTQKLTPESQTSSVARSTTSAAGTNSYAMKLLDMT